MIIAVVIAVIVVWYFFFKKKKVAESGFAKKVAGTPTDTKSCPSGCRATSVSGPSGTTQGCYCPGAGWQ